MMYKAWSSIGEEPHSFSRSSVKFQGHTGQKIDDFNVRLLGRLQLSNPSDLPCFWQFWLRIVGNLACQRDNSSQIWARLTKFAPNMHLGILSASIENEGHWPWTSRSFWQFWFRILVNLACLRDDSSQIWARITKFAPNMHLEILLAGVENEGHWPWPSRSFWPFVLKKRHSSLLLYLRSRPAKGSYTSQTYSCFT